MNTTNSETTPVEMTKLRGRHSAQADNYAKYRPNYPAVAIDMILKGCSSSSSPLVAADVGAGTGIASRQLANRGVHVWAVEPDPAMRQVVEPHALVKFIEGKAEATNLPDAFFDLVTSFQAFHWFDRRQSLKEFHRILKPSGQLALVWSHWDTSDEFTATYMRLVYKAANSPNSQSFSSRLKHLAITLSQLPSKFGKRCYDFLIWHFPHLPYFVNVRRHRLAYKQELYLTQLIGLALSQPFVPLSGLAQQQLVSDLKELHERSCNSSSLVYLVYRTTMYLADPLVINK